MDIAWILCETYMKLNAHFIHKKSSSDSAGRELFIGQRVMVRNLRAGDK